MAISIQCLNQLTTLTVFKIQIINGNEKKLPIQQLIEKISYRKIMQIGFLHKCCLNSYGNSVHANERKKEKCQDKKYNANRSERTSNLLSGTS